MIKVKLKISGKKMQADVVKTAIDEASDKTLKFAKDKLEGVTGKFNTVNVQWDENVKSPDWELSTESDIYRYLDEGTRVRYAHMTPNFVPRTSPGSFNVGPKVGGVAFIDKSRPLPGIKARKWTEATAKKTEDKAKKLFEAAIKKF
jgi:hypothetical protein